MNPMIDTIIVIDISLSMGKGYGDLRPSKLDAAKEAALVAADRILESKSNRLGIVVFYGRSLPILPLTRDKKKIVKTLYRVNFTEEGSAPGDGIVDAVKMLRGSKQGRIKGVLLITDGDINLGVPLEAALLYAHNSGVFIYTITLGDKPKTEDLYKRLMERYGWVYKHASTKNQLLSAIIEYPEAVLNAASSSGEV